MNNDVQRFTLLLTEKVQEATQHSTIMSTIQIQFDLCALNGDNRGMDNLRQKYHDAVDNYFDCRSVIANLTEKIEDAKNQE